MKKNVGLYDRVLRVIIAVGFFALGYVHTFPPGWNIFTWCLAVIVLLTAVFGICPLYGACGINTRKHSKAPM